MRKACKKLTAIVCVLAMACSVSLYPFAETADPYAPELLTAETAAQNPDAPEPTPEKPAALQGAPAKAGTAETAPEEQGLTTKNDTDPMICYFLNWRYDPHQEKAYMSDAHLTSEAGATASFSFTGAGEFSIDGKFGPDCGKAQVYLDGIDMGTFDFFSDDERYSSFFTFKIETEGDHVVKIICTGEKDERSAGSTVVLDCISYQEVGKEFLVANGGFERIDEATGMPVGWDVTGAAASVDTKVHTGSKAVLLKGKAAGVSQVIPVVPGQSYLLLGWVYAADPHSVIELGVKDHGQKDVYSVSDAGEYTCINAAFTAGPEASTATIYSTMQQGQEAYVDDLKVIPIQDTLSYQSLENAPFYQSIPTYDGQSPEGQPTHPSVLYFENGWNGYRYWMAMTPYPFNNGSFENPSIVVSDDGVEWKVPDGVENPLVGTPTPGHNCDVDLVHYKNAYTDELRMYYVEADDQDRSWVKVLASTDGITWLERGKPVVSDLRSPYGTLSPSVEQLPDGTFRMWAVDTGYDGWCCQTNTVQYRTSPNGINWSEPIDCPDFEQPGYKIWHMDVHYNEQLKKYQAVYPAYPAGTNCDYCKLFYAESVDGLHWATFSKPILTAGENGSWDDFCIYRSSLLMTEDNSNFGVWYGAKRVEKSAWHTGYSENSYVGFMSALAG